jgi:uncharacterized membrane protein (DUF2068 family)
MLSRVRRPLLSEPPRPEQSKSTTIRLIGLFKMLKGIMLIVVGGGALKLVNKNVSDVVNHWVQILRVDPENRFVHGLLERAFSVTPKQLEEISVGTFFYAALLLTEGTGLLLHKHWAEYFTVVTTGGLLPLEIYELAKHFTGAKLIVFFVNAAIVVYLIIRLRSKSTVR